MHVDVTLTPARDCRVGTEILWPLHGERLLWSVFEAADETLCARSQQSKDILVIPRPDFPVPVVVNKQQRNPYANQAYNTSSGTNNFAGGFGGMFGGTGTI